MWLAIVMEAMEINSSSNFSFELDKFSFVELVRFFQHVSCFLHAQSGGGGANINMFFVFGPKCYRVEVVEI